MGRMRAAWFHNRRPSISPHVAALLLCAAVWSSVASAQLNDKCVVNVLNRTVQVSTTGSWSLPNVPSNQGQVRARATCVGANNATTSGQSGYFTVLTNKAVDAGQ